jgi:hypothetical protein
VLGRGGGEALESVVPSLATSRATGSLQQPVFVHQHLHVHPVLRVDACVLLCAAPPFGHRYSGFGASAEGADLPRQPSVYDGFGDVIGDDDDADDTLSV